MLDILIKNGQIAEESRKEPIDVLCDLLIANNGVAQGVYFNQCASDLFRIMAHPKVFCGSDVSNRKDTLQDPEHVGGAHPRGTGTMVRRLELVRDGAAIDTRSGKILKRKS